MEGKIGIILDLHGPTFVLRDSWLWVLEASVFLVREVSCEVICRVLRSSLESWIHHLCLDVWIVIDSSIVRIRTERHSSYVVPPVSGHNTILIGCDLKPMNRNFTTPQLWGVAWIVERPLQHSGWRRSESDSGMMVSMITHDWICWIGPCNKKGWLHFCNNRILLVITVTYDDILTRAGFVNSRFNPSLPGRRPKRFREVGPFDFRAQAVISLKKPCGYEGEIWREDVKNG